MKKTFQIIPNISLSEDEIVFQKEGSAKVRAYLKQKGLKLDLFQPEKWLGAELHKIVTGIEYENSGTN